MKLFGQDELALPRGLQLVDAAVVRNVYALVALQQLGALPGETRLRGVAAHGQLEQCATFCLLCGTAGVRYFSGESLRFWHLINDIDSHLCRQ